MASRLDTSDGNRVFIKVTELSEVVVWDLILYAGVPVMMGSE